MKSLRRLIGTGFIFGTLFPFFFLPSLQSRMGERLFNRVRFFSTGCRQRSSLRSAAYDIALTRPQEMRQNWEGFSLAVWLITEGRGGWAGLGVSGLRANNTGVAKT